MQKIKTKKTIKYIKGCLVSNMSKKINKAIKLTTSIIVFIMIILAFLMVGIRIFGLEVYTVLSGSMEPKYPTGSLIYVKDISSQDLQVNDVITFNMGSNTIATHRIVEIVTDESNSDEIAFRTKGDANNLVDANLVQDENVIGKPVLCIPYLGYLANFIKTPPGIYISIAISIALILIVNLLDSFAEYKYKERNN